jgi:outer membrane protein assembly factor BamB
VNHGFQTTHKGLCMRAGYLLFAIAPVYVACWQPTVVAQNWTQFRGSNGSGLASESVKLPTEIGPETNVVWKADLPPGHSSPAIFGSHVYLTAIRDKRLYTIALARKDGKLLWEREAPAKALEKIHPISSQAASTPVADGHCVISFFGSCGLFCYAAEDGRELWHKSFGPFLNEFGMASSPIVVEDKVIINLDQDTGSCLYAFDKKTGKLIWKVDRSEFPRGYATPVIWTVDGVAQVVVPGTLRVIGYSLADGKEIWTVRGLARIANMTPVIGPDNTLYLATWAPGSDANDKVKLAPFEEVIASQDKNKNGSLEPDEVKDIGAVNSRFQQFDRDKDGHISRKEHDTMRQIFGAAINKVVAIKPGGHGDVTETHVLWNQTKGIPYIPSPIYYRGNLFLIKNGGILNCLDATTGKSLKQERVAGSGDYYSSPVAGDGKVYLISQKGDLSVVSGEPNWRLLHKAKFGEEVFATPAIAGGFLFLRTAGHLYCFAQPRVQ